MNLTRVEVTRGEDQTWRMKRGGTGEIVVSNLDATWLFVFVLNHRFRLNSAKRPAAGHGLKTIKRPATRYFSIFPFEIQIFI